MMKNDPKFLALQFLGSEKRPERKVECRQSSKAPPQHDRWGLANMWWFGVYLVFILTISEDFVW